MARNPRYDILFEPVRIGPVTAPQPLLSRAARRGMTNAMPRMRAAFRETKAEGGWGVMCTGPVSIDPSSDDAPLPFATMWDDNDMRAHALMTDAVHRHGALAGVELWHGGGSVMNRSKPPTAACRPPEFPGWRRMSASWAICGRRSMDKAGHPRGADAGRPKPRARRAAPASTSSMSMPAWAISATNSCCRNTTSAPMPTAARVDNRVRFVREMLEVTHEAVQARIAASPCASASRSCAARPSAISRPRRTR